MTYDLEPAAQRLTKLIEGVSDGMLGLPTPCPTYTVGDLIEHVVTLGPAFTAAANKDLGDLVEAPAPGDASRLADGWRTQVARDLAAMADAWRAPGAWEGMTRIGGGDAPGEVAGLIGLDELVVHGWDLARATGQDYDCDQASLEGARTALLLFQKPGEQADPGSPFGTVVEVADHASLLDEVVGLSGRDPAWTPAR